MGNRVMAAKRLKIQRERRAWARQYSRSSGQQPNWQVIGDYKERAKGLAELPDHELDIFIKAIFGTVYSMTPAGKVENEATYREWQRKKKMALELCSLLDTTVRELSNFVVIDNIHQRCRLFFSSRKDCWIILHEDFKKCVAKRSYTFNSKDAALRRWYSGKVPWVEQRPIAPRENSS